MSPADAFGTIIAIINFPGIAASYWSHSVIENYEFQVFIQFK